MNMLQRLHTHTTYLHAFPIQLAPNIHIHIHNLPSILLYTMKTTISKRGISFPLRPTQQHDIPLWDARSSTTLITRSKCRRRAPPGQSEASKEACQSRAHVAELSGSVT